MHILQIIRKVQIQKITAIALERLSMYNYMLFNFGVGIEEQFMCYISIRVADNNNYGLDLGTAPIVKWDVIQCCGSISF